MEYCFFIAAVIQYVIIRIDMIFASFEKNKRSNKGVFPEYGAKENDRFTYSGYYQIQAESSSTISQG